MPTKNSKGRVIVPAKLVMTLLRRRFAEQEEEKRNAGSAWEDSGLVFTDELGHHLNTWNVYRAFKRAATAIGRPDARVHDCRHSYAVASIRAGDDIKTVQRNLGHATAAFTLDVYGHVTEQMKRASADRMEAYIRQLKVSVKRGSDLTHRDTTQNGPAFQQIRFTCKILFYVPRHWAGALAGISSCAQSSRSVDSLGACSSTHAR